MVRLSVATASASAEDRSAALERDDFVERGGRIARGVFVALWAAILVLLLRHREIISSDTLSNYVHVWWVAENVWHGHGVPFHMAVLAGGRALTFPYAFLPWMLAALLWPLMGEWSVTVVLGVGFLALVATTFWAFPELRRGWWAAAVLANPGLVEGLLLGQLPFLWASAMLMAAVACWRRDRYWLAVALAALAQINHAAVMIPIVAGLVLLRVPFEEHRRKLVTGWLVSLIPALPAAYLVFASPVAAQNSLIYSGWIEFETVVLRSLVFVVPFGLLLMQRRGLRRTAPAWVVAILVVGQLVTIPISGMRQGWGALEKRPSSAVDALPHSAAFVPGATYRVLTFGDGKYGPYAVVRAGGRLDSEFFPESMHRRSFQSFAVYAKFLDDRKVDFVAIDSRYNRFRTNEEALLTTAATRGGCQDGVSVRLAQSDPSYELFAITRGCRPAT